MEKNKIDIKTEYLLFGFIRKLQITKKIIPLSIINLCISFYFSNQRILLIATKNGSKPSIMIAELKKAKSQYYQCIIGNLFNMKDNKYTLISKPWKGSFCLCNDLKLPDTILNADSHNKLDVKRLYDILFAINGKGSIGAYIIDSSLINNGDQFIQSYFLKLPQHDGYGNATLSLCYSAKHGLISIGGRQYKELPSIFNKFSLDEGKWEQIDELDRWRKMGLATMIEEDKLIYCGGLFSKTYVKWVSIYNFNEKKWIQMNNMNHKRCRSGIYCDKYVNKRVYIGGGKTSRAAVHTFEYFDIVKDKWLMLSDTNFAHISPIIWMSNANIVNIASVYGNVFECMDLRTSKWEKHEITRRKYRSVNCVFNKLHKPDIVYPYQRNRLFV